ncbi:hypothetical protein [Aestuariivirga sp.]|uniref:hypothetical protein n=1 Tax=Aestuariivirga sp. TaxID=2650926 RepID=UPI0039E44196
MVILENDALHVEISPAVGGTVQTIVHKPSGLSVLGSVPWETSADPLPSGAAIDEPEWLTRYSGGWPLLFPNACDACTVNGVFHGFHGEASITPWESGMKDRQLHLHRTFRTIAADMTRIMALDGDVLTIRETMTYHGREPADVMWGHHPTFGSDLLAGPVEIDCAGGRVTVDSYVISPANPLVPGGEADWPVVAGRNGDFDLRHPVPGMSSLAYLHDLKVPWISITRRDKAIAARLSWDDTLFPTAWLWVELCGHQNQPWNGQTKLIGIEPNSTRPAYGLVKSVERGGTLLRLTPGQTISTEISLKVYVPA